MSFRTPPPLTATAQILYAVETESQGYKLTRVCCCALLISCMLISCNVQANRWFFTYMIQDTLMRNFGGQYESGILNHPTLANKRRMKILSHAYKEAGYVADRASDALLGLITLLNNSNLSDGIKSFIHAFKDARVRVLII